jgi:apolipoprotein N-acyltransferase
MAYGYHQEMLSDSEHPTGIFTSSASAMARGRGSHLGQGVATVKAPIVTTTTTTSTNNYGRGYYNTMEVVTTSQVGALHVANML